MNLNGHTKKHRSLLGPPTLIIIISGIWASCTNDKVVKEIDSSLEIKGSVAGSSLGLNKNNEAILQSSTDADDELRGQVWENHDRENTLKFEYHMLKWCRQDIADTRLGGSGEVANMPEIDQMKTAIELKEEFGIENGELKVVKKEHYVDRLKAERKYAHALKDMIRKVKKSRETCEITMGQMRIKAGLPAKRYQGNITIDTEGKISKVIQANENSLDDAFRIQKMINEKE